MRSRRQHDGLCRQNKAGMISTVASPQLPVWPEMTLTPYHAKYFAHELMRRCPSDSVERFAGALVDAQVDLNPHQIEAALFAFRSPSEEVGESRTLLVMCSAFRGKADRYPNLTIKKIPKAVLARCEWGHDDYSLQIENLPKPPKKPRSFLFEEMEETA